MEFCPKKQGFWPKVNILKGNHFIFVNMYIQWIAVHQKVDFEDVDFVPKTLGPTIFEIPQPNGYVLLTIQWGVSSVPFPF